MTIFEQGPFGFGPFPPLGEELLIPSVPPGSGFGGSGFLPGPETGTPYGLGSYGDFLSGGPAFNVEWGYGGAPYGNSPYGSTDLVITTIASAVSLNGYQVEVFFTEEMSLSDVALLDPLSYTLTPTSPTPGAPSTVLSVEVGELGDSGGEDTEVGALSVIVTHTGTTLGGLYTLGVTGPVNVSGYPVDDTLLFYAKGSTPSLTVTPQVNGQYLEVLASEDFLPASQEPLGTTGVEDASSYGFLTEFPVQPTCLSAALTSPDEVLLEVQGLTSTEYELVLSPAEVLLFEEGDPLDVGLVEFGTGTYTEDPLELSKDAGDAYGFIYEDATGRLVPDCTFQVDVTFEVGSFDPDPATLAPVDVAFLHIEDGDIQVRVYLSLSMAATPYFRVDGGTYTANLNADWTTGSHTLSVLRNRKADFYSILFDGQPLASTPISTVDDAPAFVGSPSVSFILPASGFDVTDMGLGPMSVTATSTVYSQSWNFYHDALAGFEGLDAFTRATILTRRGPLVKNWGSAEPATHHDVTVRVNDVEVEVLEVNPYEGEITLSIPLPRMPPGSMSVEVDYFWQFNPVFPLVRNVRGSVHNKWDRAVGVPGHVNPSPSEEGAVALGRFPFAATSNAALWPQPLRQTHRYRAFVQEYSALTNDPTSLLRNANPHAIAVEGFQKVHAPQKGSFTGSMTPVQESWSLRGFDAGSLVGDGTYLLRDTRSNPYDPFNPSATVYSQGLDLSTFAQTIYLAARLRLDTSVNDGVFSGVGFGFHDGVRFVLLGLLEINGVSHVGLITDPTRPSEVSSWNVLGAMDVTFTSSNTFTTTASSVLERFGVGSRFQILEGLQAGTYTLTSAVRDESCGRDTFTGTIEGTWPLPINVFEQGSATAYPEIAHGEVTTYRMEVRWPDGPLQIFVSGVLSGQVASFSDIPSLGLPIPARTSLLLPNDGDGKILWGSFSRVATSNSTWSLLRYGTVPDVFRVSSRGALVSLTTSAKPEDQDVAWVLDTNAGHVEVDSSNRLLIQPLVSGVEGYESFYRRSEPLLSEAVLDLNLEARSESSPGLFLSVDDGRKSASLGFILYVEGGSSPYRKLVTLPQISIGGLFDPQDLGFELLGAVEGSREENRITTGSSSFYVGNLDLTTGVNYTDQGGRRLFFRCLVDSSVSNSNIVSLNFGLSNRNIKVNFSSSPNRIRLLNSSGVEIQSYVFDWDDQEFHDYILICNENANQVTLLIDDVAQAPTLAATAFVGGAGDSTEVVWGLITGSQGEVTWEGLYVEGLVPSGAKRTLGVLKDADSSEDINSWELPRTDSSAAQNSEEVGPVLEEMDWSSTLQVRLLWDKTWGVTVFRPDEPPPPYYSPESPTAGSGFFNLTTEPSAGWINVEDASLPRGVAEPFGSISFGPLGGLGRQRWSALGYKLFKHTNNDHRAPRGMVRNRVSIVHSGELVRDVRPRVLEFQPQTSTTLDLKVQHIYADRVFSLLDGDTLYSSGDFEFDPERQIISLRELPSGIQPGFQNSLIEVSFAPGVPVTNTYLESFGEGEGSATVLFEGTPIVPKSLEIELEKQVLESPSLDSPGVVIPQDAVVLTDPYKTLIYVKTDEEQIYADLEILTQDNGGREGLLEAFCDSGIGNEPSSWSEEEGFPVGSLVFEFSGGLFTEVLPSSSVPPLTPNSWISGFGSPGDWLYASGGSFVGPVVDLSGNIIPNQVQALGGTLGPGSAILWPLPQQPVRGGSYGEGSLSLFIESILIGEAELDLQEDFGVTLVDTTSPEGSEDADGAFDGLLIFPEEFSSVGPGAGLQALEGLEDHVFVVFLNPQDGTTVDLSDGTSTETFTARVAPALPDEFDVADPAQGFVNALLANTTARQWIVRAEVDTDLEGNPSVKLYQRAVSTPTFILTVTVSDETEVRLDQGLTLNATQSRLSMGAGIIQKSTLWGGVAAYSNLDGSLDLTQGFILSGGSPLPAPLWFDVGTP